MSDTATEVTTASVLQAMLTENTGRHLLDSGDAYGRHWQRNQGHSFADDPAYVVSWKFGIEVTASVFHFLNERLEYERTADEAWLAWATARDDEAWLQSAERWVQILGGRGLYGDNKPFVVNTYNGEDLLSQTIQYVYFTIEDGEEATLPAPGSEEADRASECPECKGTGVKVEQQEDSDNNVVVPEELCGCDDGTVYNENTVQLAPGTYVLLQIHGGADVRGGYTRPRLFSLADYDETAILDNARATLHCSAGEHYWSTDDTCHWYFGGSTADTQLEEYDRVEVDFTEEQQFDVVSGEPVGYHDYGNRIGKLVVDTDADVAYCPICGVGQLQVSS